MENEKKVGNSQESVFKRYIKFINKVKFITSDQAKGYKFEYLELDTIFEKINPLMEEFNLLLTASIKRELINEEVYYTGVCEVIDAIEGNVFKTFYSASISEQDAKKVIPTKDNKGEPKTIQSLGGTQSYLRRFALQPALNINLEKDPDSIKWNQNKGNGYQSYSKPQPVIKPKPISVVQPTPIKSASPIVDSTPKVESIKDLISKVKNVEKFEDFYKKNNVDINEDCNKTRHAMISYLQYEGDNNE